MRWALSHTDPAVGPDATPEEVRRSAAEAGFGYPADVEPIWDPVSDKWYVGKDVWRLGEASAGGEGASGVPEPREHRRSRSSEPTASPSEGGAAFAKGAAVGLGVGVGVAYGLGLAFGFSNPLGWALLGAVLVVGAVSVWSNWDEIKGTASRIRSGDATKEDWYATGSVVGGLLSGRAGGTGAYRAGLTQGTVLRAATLPMPGPSPMVEVSRWGSPGLNQGDWVMTGPPVGWNYFWSGKWQPGLGNRFAWPSAGQSFNVPASSLRPPQGWGPDGFFKVMLGQWRYMPPPPPQAPPPVGATP